MNHIPDKYEHLVRYYRYYSNRSRGAREQAEKEDNVPLPIIDERSAHALRKANWAGLIQKPVSQLDARCL